MKIKNIKGSILVMSLLIMFAILIITLSATFVSIRDRNISIGSGKSNRAFQTAQTGIEQVMKVVLDMRGGALVNEIEGESGSLVTCDVVDGLLKHGNEYTIELKDSDENKINCYSMTDNISQIVSIKAVGKEGDAKNRAIEAAVAQVTNPGVMGGCMVRDDGSGTNWNVISSWGEGCDSGGTSTNSYPEVCTDVETPLGGYVCGPTSVIDDFTGNFHVTCVCVSI